MFWVLLLVSQTSYCALFYKDIVSIIFPLIVTKLENLGEEHKKHAGHYYRFYSRHRYSPGVLLCLERLGGILRF